MSSQWSRMDFRGSQNPIDNIVCANAACATPMPLAMSAITILNAILSGPSAQAFPDLFDAARRAMRSFVWHQEPIQQAACSALLLDPCL